jgi:hypothetical protein
MRIHSLLYIVLTALFLLPHIDLLGQSEKGELFIRADIRDEAVYLRWAPTGVETLRKGTARGYELRRVPVLRNGVDLSAADQEAGTVVLANELRPDPMDNWRARADTSQFAGALAAALYPGNEEEGQAEMAYGMGMLGADHDFDAAVAAALGFVDREAPAGMHYRYELRLNGDETPAVLELDRDARPLPPPPSTVRVGFGRRDAEISWNRSLTEAHYTSYRVERSENGGKRWVTANKLPLVQILNETNYDTLQYFSDKGLKEEQEYHYRVVGTTPFGRSGPMSEIIKGFTTPDPAKLLPVITGIVEDVDKNFRIEWEMPRKKIRRITGYEVLRSDMGYAGYESRSGILPADTREWIEQEPKDGIFYRIHAIDESGRRYAGEPKLMLVEDFDPPTAPTGLTGTLDSLGQARFSWVANTEADLSGYRVYTANQPNGYFAQLTPGEITDTTYLQSVTMETTAEEVYFKVRALDMRGNYSPFSEALQLKRPDLLPPTEPLIKDITSSTEGVWLKIAASNSEDVLYHLLQRRPNGENEAWEELDTLTNEALQEYTDASIAPGSAYDYRVVAVDDAGLSSVCQAFTGRRIDRGERGSITTFTAKVMEAGKGISIAWTYESEDNPRGFQLYRAVGEGPLVAYQLVNGNSPGLRYDYGTFIYTDRDVTPGLIYTYRLLATHYGGGYSQLTTPASVLLP